MRSPLLALFLCVGFATLLPAAARAQTIVPGGRITRNTRWTRDGSPYVVHGDVVVEATAALVIDAGVEVRFANRDPNRAGADQDRLEIIVFGSLFANGTEARPIHFYS